MFSSRTAGKVIRRYHFTPGLPPAQPGEEQFVASPGVEQLAPLMDEARAHAESLLQAAHDESAEIRRQAEAEGRTAGLAAGRQEGLAWGQAQMAAEIERLQQIVDSLAAERLRVLAEAEGELVDLALAIASKVVGSLAEERADAILAMAQQAVEALGHPLTYQIHVNPQDAERLEPFLAAAGSRRNWDLVADERVAPGGCLVNSGSTQVDAQPATQLALIAQAFAGI